MLKVFLQALIRISKTGLSGAGLALVPFMAGVFGGKPSTGILLPMLIMADIFAVKTNHYNNCKCRNI